MCKLHQQSLSSIQRTAVIGLIVLFAPFATAQAAKNTCKVVAPQIEASLRAFKPRGPQTHPATNISIINAVTQKPAAGLDYGVELDDASLRAFPLAEGDRALFKEAIRRIYRAGGEDGLIMLDAVAGTADCHSPFLFTKVVGVLKAIKIPSVDDPYDLCSYGGVALGLAGRSPFYAQTENDYVATDTMKIFPLADARLGKPCTIRAQYEITHELAERFCADRSLCAAYAGKAAKWATQFRDAKGKLDDPALTAAAESQTPNVDESELPMFGAKESNLAPEPFRFDGAEEWFVLNGDGRANFVRVGAAYLGPANMANWANYTLLSFYKGDRPVASFIVELRRGAFKSLAVDAGND